VAPKKKRSPRKKFEVPDGWVARGFTFSDERNSGTPHDGGVRRSGLIALRSVVHIHAAPLPADSHHVRLSASAGPDLGDVVRCDQ